MSSIPVNGVGEPTPITPAERRKETRDSREPEALRPIEAELARTEEETIEAALDQNGREIIFGGRTIEFSFDRDLSRVIVKVRSQDTEEVVRQIPPDNYLKLVSRFRELFGVLFDETA